MSRPIEDYALIGDTHTAALVARDGSIDWLCLPRFDAPSCFGAILGDEDEGCWKISPSDPVDAVDRSYRDSTMILETTFETGSGRATLIDFMPISTDEAHHQLVRIVRVDEGTMAFDFDLCLRFEYGAVVPWVVQKDNGITALAGANATNVWSSVPLEGKDFHTVAHFECQAGDSESFVLTWYPSHLEAPEESHDAARLLDSTDAWWREWSGRRKESDLPWHEAVERSFVTLKALTYAPTGAMVAAATTSLPERLGGSRNWDYRFCWLRDASFVLDAFAEAGYTEEVAEWQRWLLRAVAGAPGQLNVMYSVKGDRLLIEVPLKWFDGYEGSTPVRIGNAAHTQFQLDVFGDVMQLLWVANERGVELDAGGWHIVEALMGYLNEHWQEPDEGIWEVRGGRKQFVHSKVMTWVAADRAARLAAKDGRDTQAATWRELASTIHDDVCQNGYDRKRNTFVQYYASDALDASLLLIPAVGFLDADDSRVVGTVAAIEDELIEDGFVRRYDPQENVDGISEHEGTFLACSFWLADCYAMMGRTEDARALFERLLSVRNDVGLLAEQYDPADHRQLGNFPQALSHVALINTAWRCYGYETGASPPDSPEGV